MGRGREEPRGKKINPTLFVFCEGDTEVAYVNMLRSHYRLPSIQIDSKVSGHNITSQYIENYKRDKPTHEKDVDYLMYDLDVSDILDKLRAIDGYTLLLSNPCIELWFLQHYKNQTAHANCDYCCKELKNRNKAYEKGAIDKKLKEKLIAKVDAAVKRVKKLTDYENPSSSIYLLIEKLNDLKK